MLSAQYEGKFIVTVSGAVVTLKQIFGGEGKLPVVTVSGAVKAAAAQTTAGVAKVSQTRYTTYVLGDGAIEYTDCGAKVPYEMDRDPHTTAARTPSMAVSASALPPTASTSPRPR